MLPDRSGAGATMYDPTAERCSFLAARVGDTSALREDVFTPRFLERVDVERVARILSGLYAEHGPVTGVRVVGPLRPGAWVFRWDYLGGARQLVHLAVEASPPHRIGSLLFGPAWDPDERDDTEPATTAFRLPFRGRWHVTWGGRTLQENHHRSAPAQRYAYDFSIVRGDAFCRGDGARNEDHYCFGEDVLAPAAGRIVRAVDGIPDNVPGEKNESHPFGNFVVVEHREREFSLLAHLKEGSVVVRVDDPVAQEQKIGECGNSGRSSKPHLHFHVQTSPEPDGGRGLPPSFVRIEISGVTHEVAEPARGQWVTNR